MKACPYCAYQNLEGVFYCAECGQILSEEHARVLATRHLNHETQQSSAKSPWGTAQLRSRGLLVIQIRDVAEPIVLQPKGEMILGRTDPSRGVTPDIDLTPYGADEKGVSRLHAAIIGEAETITLMDKGSTNGTYLNGQRLAPNQPRILRDGDEIQIGKLVCHVYFRQ